MFTLAISPGCKPPVNVVTVGRTAPFPIYFMRRSGGPVLRWTKHGKTAEHGEAGKERDGHREA